MNNTFRSLSNPNYRLWFMSASISNIGTWLQRTAQDWIVIAELSDKNASAVGWVVFLQFAPQILLLPITGWTVDKFDRRSILFITQILMSILALILSLLILSNQIVLWQVCVCAFLLGCVIAFDAPARHAFVSDIVGEKKLSNAISLNSLSFHSARFIGPAIAGLLISVMGAGWVFMLNTVSFIPMIISLYLLKERLIPRETTSPEATTTAADVLNGFRYIAKRKEMTVILMMTFLVCAFGMNFSVYLSSMTVHVFKGHADQYGLLMSIMAIGSIFGAMITASRAQPTQLFLVVASAGFAFSCTLAAFSTSFITFSCVLVLLGLCLQMFNTSAMSLMQLSTERLYRGRIMAIILATALGSKALGAPIIGLVSDYFGPRWGVGIGGISGIIAVLLGGLFLFKNKSVPLQEVTSEAKTDEKAEFIDFK